MSSLKDIKTSLPHKYNPTHMEGVFRDVLTQVDTIHPTGSVIIHAGLSVPPGFLACTGGLAGRVQYQGLFAAIGTKYGAGDGSTTFNLPNLTAPTGTMYIVRY